jgi:predicted outer membrane repeat protein
VHVQAQSPLMKPVSLKVASQNDLSALAKAANRPNAVIDAVWQGTVKLTKPIIVGESTTLSIIGENVATAIADGGGKTQLFDVSELGNLVLVNMTLTNGFTDSASGGAVRLGEFASLTARGTVFSNNAVRDSLGASDTNGSFDDAPYLPDSSFVDDETVTDKMTVGGFGGAVSGGLNSTISIINSTFVRNTASMAGGAIASEAGVEDGLIITNSVFDGNAACVNNTAKCYGGGAVAHTAFVNISNTTFHNNSVIAAVDQTEYLGGGALLDFSIGSFGSAEDSVIGRTNIELCKFTDNFAGSILNAGAAYLNGNVTLSDCLFAGNSADAGGAVQFYEGLMTIRRCTFANNTASSSSSGAGGGAVANFAKPPGQEPHLIEESIFFNNSAGIGGGGALFSIGDIFIEEANLPGLVVRSSNFSSNTAVDGNGGAISCGDIRVENCLFTSNKATAGGAISTEVGDTFPYFESVVLANNTASRGGAIHHSAGSIYMVDVKLINNTASSQGNT